MADNPSIDGVKVVHLLYEPATEVLKEVVTIKLHRNFFEDIESKIKLKFKASEARKIYPLDRRNEQSVLRTLGLDSLIQLVTILQKPYSNSDTAETLINVITITLLQNHLAKHRTNLEKMNCKRKILNRAQWKNMFPVTHEKWEKSFDITLLCVILFETLRLQPTCTRVNAPPDENETTIGDDIQRIRYYRNSVAAHGKFLKIEDCSKEWNNICSAIIRLGGPRYRGNIENVQFGTIDENLRRSYEELLKKCQLQEAIRCKTVEKLEKDIANAKCDVKTTVDTVGTQLQSTVEFKSEEVKKEVRDVGFKIRDKMNEHSSEMKSMFERYEIRVTETVTKTMQTHTKLVTEKLAEAHQTGDNIYESVLNILRSVEAEIRPGFQKEIKEQIENLRSNDVDILQTTMDFIVGYIKDLDFMTGENITLKLSQVDKQYEEISQKLDTIEETSREGLFFSPVPEVREMKEHLDQVTKDVQSLATAMTTTNTDIQSIKNDIKSTWEQLRMGCQTLDTIKKTSGQCLLSSTIPEVTQMKEHLDQMTNDVQSLATATEVKQMKERLDQMTNDVQSLATATEVKQMRERLDQITNDIQSLATATEVKQMRERLDQMATTITTTNTADTVIKHTKNALEDPHSKELEDLEDEPVMRQKDRNKHSNISMKRRRHAMVLNENMMTLPKNSWID